MSEEVSPSTPNNETDCIEINDDDDICELEHLRKLFVGGLTPRTTADDLRKFYSQFGKVVDSVVMHDPHTKRSRGFGFVTFNKSCMVDKAQDNRPHIIDGKTVEAKRALPRPVRETRESGASVKKLFVSGLKENHDEDCLEEHFKQFGAVASIQILTDKTTGKRRGFALVEFDDYDSVDKAILKRTHCIKNVVVDVKKSVYSQEKQPRQKTNDSSNDPIDTNRKAVKRTQQQQQPQISSGPPPRGPGPRPGGYHQPQQMNPHPYQQSPQQAAGPPPPNYNYWGPPPSYGGYQQPRPPPQNWNGPPAPQGWNGGPPPPPPQNAWYPPNNQWGYPPQAAAHPGGPPPQAAAHPGGPPPPAPGQWYGPAPGQWHGPPAPVAPPTQPPGTAANNVPPPQQPPPQQHQQPPTRNFGTGYQQNYGGGKQPHNNMHPNRMNPYNNNAPPANNYGRNGASNFGVRAH